MPSFLNTLTSPSQKQFQGFLSNGSFPRHSRPAVSFLDSYSIHFTHHSISVGRKLPVTIIYHVRKKHVTTPTFISLLPSQSHETNQKINIYSYIYMTESLNFIKYVIRSLGGYVFNTCIRNSLQNEPCKWLLSTQIYTSKMKRDAYDFNSRLCHVCFLHCICFFPNVYHQLENVTLKQSKALFWHQIMRSAF